MIEKIILDYLNNVLAVPAYMEYPVDEPESFVLIERTSGGEQNYLRSAMVAIQSYAASMYSAAQLNEAVKDAMRDIILEPTVASCHLNADYNYTDTTKKKYRYQAVFDLAHYE